MLHRTTFTFPEVSVESDKGFLLDCDESEYDEWQWDDYEEKEVQVPEIGKQE